MRRVETRLFEPERGQRASPRRGWRGRI